jgi:prepilin-type N-terminal cleavage/methylation domain-containing protein
MKIILKNSSGFTLIEVLIAILLLAFISLYTYKMIDTNTDTKERVTKEDRLLIQTVTAISRIDTDLTQLYSPLYSNAKFTPGTDPNAIYQDTSTPQGLFDGKSKNGLIIPQFFSEDKSTLVFFSASNRRKIADSKDSRFNWIKYSVRRTDKSNDEPDDRNLNTIGESEIVRQTIATNVYSNDINWGDVKSQVLLTHVKTAEFSFWDEKSKKFVGSILDLNENKNIIRAIKLNLIWVDEENHEQKIEKVFRVLYPYFNTKLDDIKSTDAYGGNGVPPGIPDPQNPVNPNGSDGVFR